MPARKKPAFENALWQFAGDGRHESEILTEVISKINFMMSRINVFYYNTFHIYYLGYLYENITDNV